MRQSDNKERSKTRNPELPGNEAGLALPRRVRETLFQGWGPKLMLAALAVSALCAPAMAQQVSYIPLSAAGVSVGAPDSLTAIQVAYNYADSIVQAACSNGTVENEQSYTQSDVLLPSGWSAHVFVTATCALGGNR
jgi:hypothetical protein